MNPTDLPLRDIHLPPVPRWWPLAPGWWIMALLAVAVFAALWWHRRRARQRRSALFVARRELQIFRRAAATTDPQQQVRAVSILLRRLSMSLYPRRETAGLTGEAWLAFLDQPLSGRAFSTGAGRVLLDGPYRARVNTDELEPLLKLCEAWIEAVEQAAKGRQ